MERCPTCQARRRDTPVCGRCQTDLRLSLAAETAARRFLQRGLKDWAAGDIEAARQALDDALQLQRTPLAVTLRGFLTRGRGPLSDGTVPEPGAGHATAEHLGL